MGTSPQITNLLLGGNGFIGRSLASRLDSSGQKVVSADIDVWKRGTPADTQNVRHLDLSDRYWAENFVSDLETYDEVKIWHLAANSDISRAATDYTLDYKLTLGSTLDVIRLATMLGKRCKSIEFTSSSAVYGNRFARKLFQEEDKLVPISNYGAMKEASEKMLEIYSSRAEVPLHVYRLANIVGKSMTHGVVYDLVNKLKINPKVLHVLGNGSQLKTYLDVEDLISVMLLLSIDTNNLVVNVGPDDAGVSVQEIAEMILEKSGLKSKIVFEEQAHGWPGDVVNSVMSVSKLKNLTPFTPGGSKKALEDAINSRIAEVF
jgi:UDP-glucose 4-epimerase